MDEIRCPSCGGNQNLHRADLELYKIDEHDEVVGTVGTLHTEFYSCEDCGYVWGTPDSEVDWEAESKKAGWGG